MNFKELPNITEKQKEIVNLVYKFRFIDRKQVQKILNHKDPKRINTWLRDLVEKKYLGRIYSHKLLENTKPAIYFLNNNGVLWIRLYKGFDLGTEELEFKYVKKFYEDKHASRTFIDHCVFIGDLYTQLKKAEKDRKNLEYSYLTKTELWTMYQISGEIENLREYMPDVYMERELETEKNLDTQSFFLEICDPLVPRYALRYKIKKYIEFYESGIWQHKFKSSDRSFPTILLILSDQRKLNFLSKYIQQQLEENYISKKIYFALTTYEKARLEGIPDNNIWKIV